MKNFNKARAQGGFSLIELLLVLAIIAALAVAAFIVYPRVQAGRNASYEAQVLSPAQAGVKALFTTNNYVKLSDDVALNAELFPANMKNAAGDGIENQWAGEVTAGSANPADGSLTQGTSASTGIARHFGFQYVGVPTDVCIRLAGSAVNNFGAVYIGTVKAQNLFAAVPEPVDESVIAAECKGTGGKADITFISN